MGRNPVLKTLAAFFATIAVAVIAPVGAWFALAALSMEIPAGNYSHVFPVENSFLNSRNEIRVAPQPGAGIIVRDRMTIYNLQPALNDMLRDMDFPEEVADPRIDSVSFSPPDTVRARARASVQSWPLSADVEARISARLSRINEYTVGLPVKVDVKVRHPMLRFLEGALQEEVDAEDLSMEFDLREETGIRTLRLRELRLEKSDGATHTLTLAFHAGLADFLRWLFED
ncbi:MAG: hypothetical protein MPK34_01110 [Gammaproteobacteria bacterium]|nr:hypothetical protein [Gammaproteobacteria bacterium]